MFIIMYNFIFFNVHIKISLLKQKIIKSSSNIENLYIIKAYASIERKLTIRTPLQTPFTQNKITNSRRASEIKII